MIKVLYIDDEANAEKMKSKFEILNDFDIEITPEFNISSILSIISQNLSHYNLIIVDLIMAPKKILTLEETNKGLDTGKVVIEKIRENNTDVPIIVVSIRQRDSVDERFMQQFKVSEFYPKGISAIELKDAILKHNR